MVLLDALPGPRPARVPRVSPRLPRVPVRVRRVAPAVSAIAVLTVWAAPPAGATPCSSPRRPRWRVVPSPLRGKSRQPSAMRPRPTWAGWRWWTSTGAGSTPESSDDLARPNSPSTSTLASGPAPSSPHLPLRGVAAGSGTRTPGPRSSGTRCTSTARPIGAPCWAVRSVALVLQAPVPGAAPISREAWRTAPGHHAWIGDTLAIPGSWETEVISPVTRSGQESTESLVLVAE